MRSIFMTSMVTELPMIYSFMIHKVFIVEEASSIRVEPLLKVQVDVRVARCWHPRVGLDRAVLPRHICGVLGGIVGNGPVVGV